MTLRRQHHILEHTPNNLAQSLHGSWRQAHAGTYYADGADDDQQSYMSHLETCKQAFVNNGNYNDEDNNRDNDDKKRR